MNTREYNFDGLVGPTHHFGGLALGNKASQSSRDSVSHPRAAALEGLEKMKLLADRGIPQAVLPPHPRPHWKFLQQHGFFGTPDEIIRDVAAQQPELLSVAYSSSAMWTANAATISPGADTGDGRIHITPANLMTLPHRALESEQTTAILKRIFHQHRYFSVYDPLPHDRILADEGAANHMRLSPAHGIPGLEIFVYGRDIEHPDGPGPSRFPARQTKQAGERIAALHELAHDRRFFVQQLPHAIDMGVFHNDVIAVSNEFVLLCHERAFINQAEAFAEWKRAFPGDLQIIEISEAELSLEEAIKTYLFNSQLISLPQSSSDPTSAMLLLCPKECEEHLRARRVIDRILAGNNPVSEVHYVSLRESMKNGGGPACLRLRIVMTDAERDAISRNILFTEALHQRLGNWITQHYREELRLEDLAHPSLPGEVQQALEELAGILEI